MSQPPNPQQIATFVPQSLKSSIMEVTDSSGILLNDGGVVTLIKDQKVKGTSTILKRGTKVKSIRLTDNECKIDKFNWYSKTAF